MLAVVVNHMFGSDRSSRSHNLRTSVRLCGSKFSRGLIFHLSDSNLHPVISQLSQLSLLSLSSVCLSVHYKVLYLHLSCSNLQAISQQSVIQPLVSSQSVRSQSADSRQSEPINTSSCYKSQYSMYFKQSFL